MYSSVTKTDKRAARTAFRYLLVTLFCILFGAVYEKFSHEVYSSFMIYAFLFPLLGGVLPFLGICLWKKKYYPPAVCARLYHSGIAALTTGSIVHGILEIYGTTNHLEKVYWYVGSVLVFTAFILAVGKRRAKKLKRNQEEGALH